MGALRANQMSESIPRSAYRPVLPVAFLLLALPAVAFAVCTGDIDCSDNLFCNGIERCMPGAPNADANGCVPATSIPCADQCHVCNEDFDICDNTGVDSDGDGHNALPCGEDCDDSDSGRFPANPEVCNHHDEDCDPATFGERDADKDGFFDGQCCNHNDLANTDLCGDDCDDSNPAVIPGAMVCHTDMGKVLICNPGGGFQGGFQAANCGDVVEQTCLPQPNGTGICVVIKKPK